MKIEIVEIEGVTNYKLLEDYEYDCGVVVPEGYIWDGASSFSIASWIIPKAHSTLIPSCIHDYLCDLATNDRDRKKADKIFEYELRKKGFSKTRSKLGYWGVRVGALLGIGSDY